MEQRASALKIEGEVLVKPLTKNQIGEASYVLAEAYCTDPRFKY